MPHDFNRELVRLVQSDIGVRLKQMFSKFCMSLQSLLLENVLQTFCNFSSIKCRLFADFLQTSSVDQLLSCTFIADFLQQMIPDCKLHAHLFCICRLLQNNCTLFAENMIPLCRLHAHHSRPEVDLMLMQISALQNTSRLYAHIAQSKSLSFKCRGSAAGASLRGRASQ